MQRAWACAAAALLACGSSGSPLPEPSSSPGITAPAATPAPPPATPGAPTPIAGPAPSDPFHGVPAAPEDSGCHPLAERHCFLPYPSNWFSRRDGATATGLRPRVPDGIVGADVLRDLAPEFHPGALLTPSDGFASAGPILFALPAPLDRGSLPPDGGKAAADAAVVVFDLDTGERIPVRAEPSDYAASRAVREPRTLVQVFPRGRFAYGHHYVAAVTRALRPQAAGLSYPIPSLWRAALAGSPEPAAAYHAPLLAFLGAQGVDASRIIALTDFTVRSEADATARTLRLMESAYKAEHPVRNLRIAGSAFARTEAQVEGEVRLLTFRGASGDIDDTALGEDEWVPFVLTIPESAKKTPAPVALYGHALMADRNLLLPLVVPLNSERGYATLAIDHPNHGARATANGGHIATLMTPASVPRLVGLLAQSPVDLVSMLKAVRTSLAAVDAAPRRLLGDSGDGQPDLDPTRVVYEGTSLGGVLGSAFVAGASALHLDLRGAYLQVSGAGMINTLAHSSLWEGLYSNILPKAADGAEAMWLLAVVGQRIERGDALSLAHRITGSVVVSYGLDDEVVPNQATLALAEVARLPVLNAVLRGPDVAHLPYAGLAHPARVPRDGQGLLQLRIRRSGAVPLDLETHLTFLDAADAELRSAWLAGL